MFVSMPALAKRFECRAKFRRKKLGLLPRSEVAAFVERVVIDQFVIRPICPTPRGLIDLARKDAHGSRDGDVDGV